mmetsp:Transcript_52129/g.91005  ORF Transcript_52129/g.91005 Transcript_52129/m.91005 type:complete len:202 (+) Transcript_52129:196-801(+)
MRPAHRTGDFSPVGGICFGSFCVFRSTATRTSRRYIILTDPGGGATCCSFVFHVLQQLVFESSNQQVQLMGGRGLARRHSRLCVREEARRGAQAVRRLYGFCHSEAVQAQIWLEAFTQPIGEEGDTNISHFGVCNAQFNKAWPRLLQQDCFIRQRHHRNERQFVNRRRILHPPFALLQLQRGVTFQGQCLGLHEDVHAAGA